MVLTRSAVKAGENNKPTEDVVKSPKSKSPKAVKAVKKTAEVVDIRGQPKSGRFWKNEKTKFSSIVKTKGIKSTFEKKKALQEQLKRTKEATNALRAAKREEVELKKERRRVNLKRQEENRKKSEVVQVITNTSKIKKMRKKQLRYIEKRDTSK